MKKALGFVLTIILMGSVAHAHNGVEHTMGTVVSKTGSSITVKTKDGNTKTVQVNGETKYTQMNKPVTLQEVKAGDRVVINTPEGKHMATSVTIGMAGMKGMSGDMSGMKMPESSHSH